MSRETNPVALPDLALVREIMALPNLKIGSINIWPDGQICVTTTNGSAKAAALETRTPEEIARVPDAAEHDKDAIALSLASVGEIAEMDGIAVHSIDVFPDGQIMITTTNAVPMPAPVETGVPREIDHVPDGETIDEFLASVCEVCPGAIDPATGYPFEVEARQLLAAYEAWCRTHGHRRVSLKVFGIKMGQLGIGRRKSNGQRIYVGARLAKGSRDPDPGSPSAGR